MFSNIQKIPLYHIRISFSYQHKIQTLLKLSSVWIGFFSKAPQKWVSTILIQSKNHLLMFCCWLQTYCSSGGALLIGNNNPLSLFHFLGYLENKMQLSFFNLNFCCSSKTETIIRAMTQKQGCKYLQMLMFVSFLALWKPATRKDY